MGEIIGIVGPSGVGKGYAKQQIKTGLNNGFVEPIVVTTRPQRAYPEPDRMAGVPIDDFIAMKQRGEVLFAHQPFGEGTYHYGFLASSFQQEANILTEVHVDNVGPFKELFGQRVKLIGLVADRDYLEFNLDNRASETLAEKGVRLDASEREVQQILTYHKQGLVDHVVEATMINRDIVIQDILVGLVSRILKK